MRVAAGFLLASVSLAALGQAAAADTPQSAAQIRVVPYSPLLRTEIVGVIGQPTTITFPPGESVYRVVRRANPIKMGRWRMRAGKGQRHRRSRTRRSAIT